MAKLPISKTTTPAVKKTAAKKVPAVKAAAPAAPVVKKTAVPAAPVAKKVAAKKVAVKKAPAAKAAQITTIITKLDAGFGNELYIRGNGGNLSWESGVLMSNIGADEWVWTSTAVTGDLEFKVLLNDSLWASGQNGTAFPGSTVVFEPVF